MIIYQKLSLFVAPLGSILVHACNAQGVWGSGIAVEFKKRFPEAFTAYNAFCTASTPDALVGKTLITGPHNGYYIGCMITSRGYGVMKDPPHLILKQTEHAVRHLLTGLQNPPAGLPNLPIPIYSNKFNSGFFAVPWEESEKVLNHIVGATPWNIMDPNL